MPQRSLATVVVPLLVGLSIILLWGWPSHFPSARANLGVLYAAPTAQGNGDCSDWDNACTLQTALSQASSGDEIWIQAGVHYPGTARTDAFILKPGVALYGGFAGTENSPDERNWQTNITVLSGDVDRNDITDPNGVITDTANIQGANAYHVVYSEGVTETAVLDGCVLTAGQSDGYVQPDDSGGGMYNNNSSPVLRNVTFSGNFAIYFGGGMQNHDSSPNLTNVTFSGNSASYGGGMGNWSSSPMLTDVVFGGNSAIYYGGGMFNWCSSPSLTNVTFSGNFASHGGGMENWYSSLILTNVTFSGNSVNESGGGIYNHDSSSSLTNVTFSGNSANYVGGGMYNNYSSSSLTNVTFSGNSANDSGGGMYNNYHSISSLTNVIFSGNSASTYGGGMYNDFSNLTLINVTFSGNSANNSGGGMYNAFYSGITLANSILWGNHALNGPEIYNCSGSIITASYSIVKGGCPTSATCGNLLDADPRFVNPASGNLRLGPGSPAIDAGDNDACPADDLDGIARPVGFGCDIGAYEVHDFTVTLSKSASDPVPDPGQVVTFTVTIANIGPGLTGGLISDTLPAGLHFIGPITLEPPSTGVVESAPPTLAHSLTISAYHRVTATFPVSVALGLTEGTRIINTAVFTAPVLPSAASGTAALSITRCYIYLPLALRNMR